jgi:hypothetical protein
MKVHQANTGDTLTADVVDGKVAVSIDNSGEIATMRLTSVEASTLSMALSALSVSAALAAVSNAISVDLASPELPDGH